MGTFKMRYRGRSRLVLHDRLADILALDVDAEPGVEQETVRGHQGSPDLDQVVVRRQGAVQSEGL